MALLEVRNLTKIFDLAESPFGSRRVGEVRAVDDVSLDIHEGETLGLVGESGSGKSTLGRLILRLIEPTSGTIVFDGIDLLQANGSELRRLRRDMQIIFQDPFGSLDPRYRVEDVIAEPLILHQKDQSEKVSAAMPAASAYGSFCVPWEWMNPPCPVIRTNSPEASASASALPALSPCGRSLSSPMNRFQLSMSVSARRS